jgi:hypothetical protein
MEGSRLRPDLHKPQVSLPVASPASRFLSEPDWLLWLILLLALLVRMVNSFAYPFMDEFIPFHAVTQMYLTRQLPTADTYICYPALYALLIALPTGAWAVLLAIIGTIPHAADFSALAKVEPGLCLLPGRFLNVGAAILTLVVLYSTARKLFGQWPALFALASLAFSGIHIARSATAQPDVSAVLFSALCVRMSLAALESTKVRDFAWAGCFAGLAAASKYFPGMIVAAVVAAHILLLKREGRFLQWQAWFDKRLLAAAAASMVSFVAASPYWLFDASQWWRGIFLSAMNLSQGHFGTFGTPYLGFFANLPLSESMIHFFFAAGIIAAFVRHEAENVLLLSSVIIPFAYMGIWPVKQPHYLLFLYPSLALMGAGFIKSFQRAAPSKALLVAGFCCFFFFPALGSISNAYCTTKMPDNRNLARDWIQQNAPEDSTVALDWEYVPPLFTREYKDSLLSGRSGKFFETYFAQHSEWARTYNTTPFSPASSAIKTLKADYIVLSSGCYDRFFTTTPPPEENPMWHQWHEQREAYGALLNNPKALGWTLAADVHSGTGPLIKIFTRVNPGTGPNDPTQ